MKIESYSQYNLQAFQSICDLHNELCREIPLYQEWTVELNFNDFNNDSAFNQKNHWRAFLLYENKSLVACAIVFKRKDSESDFASIGYFEALEKVNLTELFKSCEQYGRELGASELRGPIQGSIFNSYKFKMDSKIYMGGDPIHPVYYPKIWEQYGYKLCGRWSNIEPSRLSYFLQLILPFIRHSFFSPICVRKYDPHSPEQELKNVYRIVMDSYSQMHSFEEVSFEEFKIWNSSLLNILKDWNCLFAVLDDEEVGFNINIPLPYIEDDIVGERLLLAYIGKIKNLGKRGRGVGDSVTRFQVLNGLLPIIKPVPIVTGVYENSPIRKWLVRFGMKELTQYGLYSKAL